MMPITDHDVVRALKELRTTVTVSEIAAVLGTGDTRAIATAARKPAKDGRIRVRYPRRGGGAVYRYVRMTPNAS
jgi:hypothetical protein